MPKRIVQVPCIINGAPRKPGDEVEVTEIEAKELERTVVPILGTAKPRATGGDKKPAA